MARDETAERAESARRLAIHRAYRESTQGIQFVKIPRDMEPERICLSTLSPVEKRQVWQNLKGTPLGDLLAEPTLQDLVRTFDAQIHIRTDDL